MFNACLVVQLKHHWSLSVGFPFRANETLQRWLVGQSKGNAELFGVNGMSSFGRGTQEQVRHAGVGL